VILRSTCPVENGFGPARPVQGRQAGVYKSAYGPNARFITGWLGLGNARKGRFFFTFWFEFRRNHRCYVKCLSGHVISPISSMIRTDLIIDDFIFLSFF
jgi:hypothetical protein